jgi:hypothetical protein
MSLTFKAGGGEGTQQKFLHPGQNNTGDRSGSQGSGEGGGDGQTDQVPGPPTAHGQTPSLL